MKTEYAESEPPLRPAGYLAGRSTRFGWKKRAEGENRTLMAFRPSVFETDAYTGSATSAHTHHESRFFSRNGLIRSIGIGKIIVEFFSVAISASVCR